jgi:hypothetical protein
MPIKSLSQERTRHYVSRFGETFAGWAMGWALRIETAIALFWTKTSVYADNE